MNMNNYKIVLLFLVLIPLGAKAQIEVCKYPGCGKFIAKSKNEKGDRFCPYYGKHPKPDPNPVKCYVHFGMRVNELPAQLFIDGVQKDSIGGKYGSKYYNLNYGKHSILLKSPDKEDYTETITVDGSSPSYYAFEMNRDFSGKNISQLMAIGNSYYNGTEGREESQYESYWWFKKAAETGNDSVQYFLGKKLVENQIRNIAAFNYGRELLRKSAEQGNRDAQFEEGYAYYHGWGVDKNYAESMKWFKLAAEQGNKEAWFYIGAIYYHARGVERDYAKAMECFKKSASYKVAQDFLGYMYEKGLGVAPNDSIAEEWYLKSANQGYSAAQKRLGDFYSRQRTKVSDYEETKKGAVKKFNGRLTIIGVDYQKAAKWYEKAAEQDNAEAQVCLAKLYIEGKGVRNDTITAIQWLRKALIIFDKEDDYKSAYNTGLKLIQYDRNEYIKSPAMNKKDYSIDLGNTSYYALFQKKYDEAEKMVKEAIGIVENYYGPDHLKLASPYVNLATIFLSTNAYDKALELYDKVMHIYERHQLENSYEAAVLRNHIGMAYRLSNHLDEAEKYYLEAIQTFESSGDDRHPDLAIAYESMAVVRQSQNRVPEALDLIEKALAINISNYGETHQNVGLNYNVMGRIYYLMDDTGKAIECFKKALPILKQAYGDDHHLVGICSSNLNEAYAKQGLHQK